ncbi:MAG: hypothetical protein U0229_15310 [Anaeromyxobacter sp.]
MRALSLTCLLLLAACGDGLYTAAGLPSTEGPGNGNTCDANQVVCAGDATNTCRAEGTTLCGSGCQDCTGLAIPANTTAVCNLGRAADGHGACGYACADGFFACATGCCGATAVAASGDSSYAVVSDGTVHAWGANGAGQLGDGSRIGRTTPVLVKLDAGAVASAVAAGPTHACAIVAGGAVRCWGSNANGEVTGAATSGTLTTPTATPVGSGAVEIAAGGAHTCAVLGSGAVTCWGAPAQTAGAASISGATAIAAGASHTCAVVTGGAVKCWGANLVGQLGGILSSGVATPAFTSGAITAGPMKHVTAYGDHTCASTETAAGKDLVDAVWCWGDVLGATFALAAPQLTPAIPMKDASKSTIRSTVTILAMGRAHVCTKSGDGVICFGGDNALGQLGGTPAGASEGAVVSGSDAAWSAFSAGSDHACAILGSGALRCWGGNAAGQLGDGTTTTPGTGTLVAPKGT